ncbi:hypothetical protein EG329_013292 [Mollisiaceae sp. DMI_Dod_QoI]|nr:hypothetical protein EG329_013292 [Helotiales sp. DMI_Dod_QoI]
MALPFLVTDKQKFLNSESQWTNRLGEGWKGTKFLGQGSFGVTGLWEYQGKYNDPKAPAIKQVVVKMAQMFPGAFAEDGDRSALEEGRIGRIIAGFGSNHLIRQFGGNRVGDHFSEMEDVVRIFLEYCPGGSLHQFLPQAENLTPPPLHEADLWQIFDCMAKGVYAMERETEEYGADPYTGTEQELMHCDLKPDNIFFGNRDPDHLRMPITKIADFGEALYVDSYGLQSDEDGTKYLERGAPAYKPPEEAINKPYGGWKGSGIPLIHPRKGTCSNIWQIGAIINAVILRAHMDFNPDDIKGAKPPLADLSELKSPSTMRHINLASQLNHSQGLESKEITDLYSLSLLTLVQECLFREPEHRPKAQDLIDYTNLGLQKAMLKLNLLKRSFKYPILPPPFRNMKISSGVEPPEPPTAWNIDHVQLSSGEFVDMGTEPPTREPTVFSATIGIISPIVAEGLRLSMSSTTSIFSILSGTITGGTTPGPTGAPRDEPNSPPTPARRAARGIAALTGVGAKFFVNKAFGTSSGSSAGEGVSNSDDFEIV